MPTPSPDTFLQYGSFGLLAVLVWWILKVGIPSVLRTHQESIDKLVTTFAKESEECRAERLALAAAHSVEREKDQAEREKDRLQRDKDREIRNKMLEDFRAMILGGRPIQDNGLPVRPPGNVDQTRRPNPEAAT